MTDSLIIVEISPMPWRNQFRMHLLESQQTLKFPLIVILREAKHSRRIYWRTNDGFCNSGQRRLPCRMTRWMADNEFKNPKFCQIHQLPKYSDFPINSHCWQIVILRKAKRSRRIYWRTNDGFCISGQRRPPCRMTRWVAENEFKNPKFCQIHQFPKIFRFSYKLSLLANCHSARSEAKSQNRIVILR